MARARARRLRILSATLAADSGIACIDGDSGRGAANPKLRRRIGMLPHNAGLYPALTARENIEYFGAPRGPDRARRALAPPN